VFSPLIAFLSTIYSPFSLMGLGLSAWVVAAGLAATAPSYGAMVVARVVSGIGEASFQCLAPCFIDDTAPPRVKVRLPPRPRLPVSPRHAGLGGAGEVAGGVLHGGAYRAGPRLRVGRLPL
jgi:MFS family permease